MISERERTIILIANDRIAKADAIVILEGDGGNRIQKACELYLEKAAPVIIFSGGIKNLAYGSYPFELIHAEFDKFAEIDKEKIIVENKSQHTRQQAEEVVGICIQQGWHKVILVASHYHQYRAFLTFLKVLYEKGLQNKIQIFNAPANKLNWFENNEWGRRIDLLALEFLKVEEYFEKGHMPTYTEIIEYFEWREQHQ